MNLSEYGKTVNGLKNNTQFSQNLTPLTPFFTPLTILVLTPSSDNFEKLTINYYNLSLVKTDATLSANNSQYCLMFTLPLFAHPVACGCVLLGVVAQSLKQVKLIAAFKQTQNCQHYWANNVGNCCVRLYAALYLQKGNNCFLL